MKSITCLALLMVCAISRAAPPIDGLYTSIFGGYTYLPGNVNHVNNDNVMISSASYQGGYNAGGSIGYQSTPMRYEGQITYLNTNISRFNANNVTQIDTHGYTQSVLGMANIFYDFVNLNPILQPFLGGGIGYGWFQTDINSTTPSVNAFEAHNSTFAYQGSAGITFNFAENYAVNLNYRFIGTARLGEFGKMFQAHLANATAIYRFDGSKYK